MSNKTVRKTIVFRSIPLFLLSALMICSLPVFAQYSFEAINPPGSTGAQVFGVNNAGTVVGVTNDEPGFSFTYDMKKGKYTTIDGLSVLGISNSGVMVGDVDGVCAIRDKKGNITLFSPPSEEDFCQARGVTSNGLVNGYVTDEFGFWMGFVHDPKKGTFEEFLPSFQTLAHGINAHGQSVGSVYLLADEAYPGSVEGFYGYLREKNGDIKYFEIDQSVEGRTRARGISASGLVSGFYLDSVEFVTKAFVIELSKGTEFETVTLTDDQVIYHSSPCNPDFASPGPDYEHFVDMFGEQPRNDGVVVGVCRDLYFNGTTGDLVIQNSGFIATPE